MLVTTSRDPSAKARRFGKALASFLSLPYVNRGKHISDKEETWMVVVEDHGNPHGLVKRSSGKEEQLTFTLLEEPIRGRLKSLVPVVVGSDLDALKIAQFFELVWLEEYIPAKIDGLKRALVVASGQIDFIDEGKAKFRLKI
jgi:rRNA maturation protein Rpf1